MFLEYPKMLYKTLEDYRVVKDESELQNAISEGFRFHNQITSSTGSSDGGVEQVKAPNTQVSKKVKKK